jgi:hypothetical protein
VAQQESVPAGDALIHRATVSLFEKFGIDSAPVEEAAVIFYGGGGNMGEFYPTPKGQRESLLKLSKDLSKPLVVLPQSFVTPDDFQCYRIFVRERESQRLRPDAILAPDLVLGLEIEEVTVWAKRPCLVWRLHPTCRQISEHRHRSAALRDRRTDPGPDGHALAEHVLQEQGDVRRLATRPGMQVA